MTDATRSTVSPLRRERELRGWSQQDVADAIGAPAASYVSRWERGTVLPSPYYQRRLCELFERDAEQLGLLDAAPGDIEVTGRRVDGSGAAAADRRRLIVLLAAVVAVGALVGILLTRSSSNAPPATTGGAASPVAAVDGRVWPVVAYDLHHTTETVRAAQLLLSTRGFDIGSTGPDGVFGSFTEAAVRNFQSSVGLASTGIVDGPTWQKLVQPLSARDRGHAVEAVQRLLVNGGQTPGAIDGVMGPQTQSAVRSFQSAHGLPSTGDVDVDTWLLLLGGHR